MIMATLQAPRSQSGTEGGGKLISRGLTKSTQFAIPKGAGLSLASRILGYAVRVALRFMKDF